MDMGTKDSLDTIIISMRAGWHGALITGTCAVFAPLSGHLGVGALSLLSSYVGISFFMESLDAYTRTRDHIQRFDALGEDFAGAYLPYYCQRQGARTAAVRAGYKSRFDALKAGYEGKMQFRWVPHL